MVTLKPPTPLQPLIQVSMKPPSPLHLKTAPKTPISHPQRRRRFQPHTGTSAQRRQRFQTTRLPGRQGLAAAPRAAVGPNRHTFACNSPAHISCFEMQSLKFRAFRRAADCRHQGIACETEDRARFEARGSARLRDDAPRNSSRKGPTGVEGAAGTGGPGCGARGRWQGLAGLRGDAQSQGYRTFRVAGVSPRCCGRGWRGGVRSSKLRRPSRG